MTESRINQGDREKLLLAVGRIENKVDRMSDRIKITEERVESLLDVITGNKSGAGSGMVVRMYKLEDKVTKHDEEIEELQQIREQIDELGDKLDDVLDMQKEHPSLLYLLRFKTKQTIIWIVIAFIILSLWYVSGFRQPILEFLGIPIF